MAIYTFQASAGAAAGKTVKVTTAASVVSVPATLTCTQVLATSILVTNTGAGLVFVRMSAEATPVATAADVPVLAGSSRIFTNPVPLGLLGVAVIPATAAANDVYFTPGTGGV